MLFYELITEHACAIKHESSWAFKNSRFSNGGLDSFLAYRMARLLPAIFILVYAGVRYRDPHPPNTPAVPGVESDPGKIQDNTFIMVSLLY